MKVDLITGVSGGSFTALAYALYGDRLFSEYRTPVPQARRAGCPDGARPESAQLAEVSRRSAGRSELAAELLRRDPVRRRDLRDLLDKQGPVAIATGTDLSTGSAARFFQNDFDLLCSDLNKVRLSRARRHVLCRAGRALAGDAHNYGGTCGYQYPA